MLASNASLKWVNYPTQVLGKSCKPIPVMLLGVFFAGLWYLYSIQGASEVEVVMSIRRDVDPFKSNVTKRFIDFK